MNAKTSVSAVKDLTTAKSIHKPLVVKHWMTPSPHTVGKDQKLSVAHALMREHGLRHLPVLEKGKLVGILSQRDLYFLESIKGVDVDVDRVEDAMSQEVYCVAPEARIGEIIPEMAAHRYGCVVVIEGRNVVGVFTTTDALNLLADRIRTDA